MRAIGGAKLLGWGARVLYLGPAFGLTPHRNATAVLAVGLDAALEVADDPADPATDYRSTRSVLILPNSLHHLRIARGRMAFLYVDPLGRDLKALLARMTDTRTCGIRFADKAAVIEIMTGLAEDRIAARDGRSSLGELLGVARAQSQRADIGGAAADAGRAAQGAPAHRIGGTGGPVGVAIPASVQGGDRRAVAALPDLEPDGGGGARLRRGLVADGSCPRRRLCQFGAFQQRISGHVRHDAVRPAEGVAACGGRGGAMVGEARGMIHHLAILPHGRAPAAPEIPDWGSEDRQCDASVTQGADRRTAGRSGRLRELFQHVPHDPNNVVYCGR